MSIANGQQNPNRAFDLLGLSYRNHPNNSKDQVDLGHMSNNDYIQSKQSQDNQDLDLSVMDESIFSDEIDWKYQPNQKIEQTSNNRRIIVQQQKQKLTATHKNLQHKQDEHVPSDVGNKMGKVYLSDELQLYNWNSNYNNKYKNNRRYQERDNFGDQNDYEKYDNRNCDNNYYMNNRNRYYQNNMYNNRYNYQYNYNTNYPNNYQNNNRFTNYNSKQYNNKQKQYGQNDRGGFIKQSMVSTDQKRDGRKYEEEFKPKYKFDARKYYEYGQRKKYKQKYKESEYSRSRKHAQYKEKKNPDRLQEQTGTEEPQQQQQQKEKNEKNKLQFFEPPKDQENIENQDKNTTQISKQTFAEPKQMQIEYDKQSVQQQTWEQNKKQKYKQKQTVRQTNDGRQKSSQIEPKTDSLQNVSNQQEIGFYLTKQQLLKQQHNQSKFQQQIGNIIQNSNSKVDNGRQNKLLQQQDDKRRQPNKYDYGCYDGGYRNRRDYDINSPSSKEIIRKLQRQRKDSTRNKYEQREKYKLYHNEIREQNKQAGNEQKTKQYRKQKQSKSRESKKGKRGGQKLYKENEICTDKNAQLLEKSIKEDGTNNCDRIVENFEVHNLTGEFIIKQQQNQVSFGPNLQLNFLLNEVINIQTSQPQVEANDLKQCLSSLDMNRKLNLVNVYITFQYQNASELLIHSIIYKHRKIKTRDALETLDFAIIKRKCEIPNDHNYQYRNRDTINREKTWLFCRMQEKQKLIINAVSSKCIQCRRNLQGLFDANNTFAKICECGQGHLMSIYIKKIEPIPLTQEEYVELEGKFLPP